MSKDYDLFKELTFDKFKELAANSNLSVYEKIGFPNAYRQDFEAAIFKDIRNKLSNLELNQKVILDIGPGCSDVARQLIDLCAEKKHTLILIDSSEMLSLLPDHDFIKKIPAKYPDDCLDFLNEYHEKIDVVLCYSVLHYVYAESNIFKFLDKTLKLLAPSGQFLIGDIPNISKRKRFFSTANGIAYHQAFTGDNSTPDVKFNTIDEDFIDDAVLLALVLRSRAAGFDGYLLPQANDLPMSNRREDLLITRP